MTHSKRYNNNFKKVDRDKSYSIEEAAEILSGFENSKFDESVDLAINLGVDPKHADQLVRGTVALPNGVGKDVKVLVLCPADKDQEALDAGADYVGLDEYIAKIKGGWTDVDVIITTPQVMGKVGALGRVLGPRGLMPNPKVGTVTVDVTDAVKAAKGGEVQFRAEKGGVVHAGIGKASFDESQLVENVKAFIDAVAKARPTGSKGSYMKGITLSSTMGPGVTLSVEKSAG